MKNIYLLPTNPRNFFSKAFIAIALLTFTASMAAWGQTTVTYDANGSFVVPAGVTSVTVECWGGGGGGRSSAVNGGGGGGGAYTKASLTGLTVGSTIDITVGGAGAVDNDGGTTITKIGSTTVASAYGGKKGTTTAGGDGGAAQSGYTAAYAGGKGGNGTTSSTFRGGGGGGGSAYTYQGGGIGSNGAGGLAISGGKGGAGGSGTGNGGKGANYNSTADAGTLPGGGGGGRGNGSGGDSKGNAGAKGRVTITYTCTTYSLTSSTTSVSPICTSSGTSTVALTGSSSSLPVGTYTVTYNRSSPSATGLTASMTVSTAGTGILTAAGLTTAGSSTITVTNLSSGTIPSGAACSSAISANNTTTITVKSPPTTATNGSTQNTCSNITSVTLSGNNPASGSGVWSVVSGPSTLSTQFSSTSAYNATFTPAGGAGSYVVRWTISNSPCTASYKDATITVNTASTATAGGPNSVCQSASPTAITLTGASVGGGATTGAWSIVSGGGSLSSTAQTANPAAVTYTPAANYSGSVTLRLTSSNLSGCSAATSDRSITVLPLPTAPTITGKLCAGNTTVGGTSTENGLTLEVFAGATSIGTTTVSSGTWSATVTALVENDIIIAKVLSSNGCYSTPSNAVTVGASISNLSYSTPVSYCTGALISTNSPSITGTGTITYSVNTSLPDGLEINENTGKINGTPATVAAAANFTITADNGCNSTDAVVNITINPTPAVSSVVSGDICSGIAQNYDITSTVSGTTYSWSRAAVVGVSNTAVTGQTSNPIAEALINTHAAGGTAVNVTYLITPATASCTGNQFTYTVAVHTPSTSVTSITKNPSTIIFPGQDVTLTRVGGVLGSGDSWVWYEVDCGSGSPVATGASVIVNPLATTTYFVRGEGICNATLCASVTVEVSQFDACNMIYVSTSGNDNDPGSSDYPVKTLSKAMTLVSSSRNHIKMATGSYTESKRVNISTGLIIEGGFTVSGVNWTKSSNAATNITFSANTGTGGTVSETASTTRHLIGIAANAKTNWTLQDLNITTAAVTGQSSGGYGSSNYAVWINGSSNYNIIRCNFTSGAASAGSAGTAGANGAAGSAGGAGGGTGNQSGGAGGSGGAGSNSSIYSVAGTNGSNAIVNSGTYGIGGTTGGGGGTDGSSCGNDGSNGNIGGAGSSGVDGGVGTAASLSGSNFGIYFVPGVGATGAIGNGGGGGKGGGGAGAGRSCNLLGDVGYGTGGSGGKGGGGGGGGTGGSGGKGGGSSFGMYRYNDGLNVNISNFNVTAGTGGTAGTGAAGGNGGASGAGANGGAGSAGSYTWSPATGGTGGKGGAGGAGGKGGTGGAGSTGASYGMITTNGSSYSGTNPASFTIPTTPLITVLHNTNIICKNSEITISKASGTWSLPTGISFIEDKKPSSSSYDASSATALVYSTAVSSIYNLTLPLSFLGFIHTSDENRTLGTISGDAQVCEGSTETFSYSSTDYTALNWEIHDASGILVAGSQFTGSEFSFTFDNSGTFYVRLIANSECCGRSIPIWYEVTVSPNVTPTFTAVGPYCSGATIPALPTTSNNSITGTWSPAISNTTTTTYTFTPTAGQCAATTTLDITINPNVTPTFTAVGPYCSGATIPALPTTSNNSITGTWSPAISNTATTTYTFTPTAGQCAPTTTLEITIDQKTIPTFTAVGPYCSGATIPALPTTSNNSITGTWSPAISNTATTTYTFTPTAGQCATTTTLEITINPNVTPTFTAVVPYCSEATIPALPTTSNNSITGTWSPAISNTATATYTFTPTAGQCATITTLEITINPNVTPTFTAVGPYCSGATIPALPTTSNNSITGTWSPAISNTATTTYTFTPTAGQCAPTTTMEITINPLPAAVTISGGGTQSCGSMTLTASGGTGGTIYWQGTTSGGTSTATASSSESVSTSGTYYFRPQSAAGCWGTEGSAIVVTNPNPIVSNPSFTNPTICTGGSTVASSIVSGTGTLSYQWQYYNTSSSSWEDVIDGTPSGTTYSGSTSTSLSISGTTALGTHQYRLYVLSSNGCDTYGSGASYSVVINPTITKQPRITTRICPGGSFELYVIATGGTPLLTYQWYKGDVAISGSTSSTYTELVSDAGLSRYHCVISNDCGYVVSDNGWIHTSLNPSAPTATKSPNVDIVCAGETLSLIGVTGSGSFFCDFEFSYNGGDWTYTPTMIAIEGRNTISVRTNCSNCDGCGNSSATTYLWTALPNPLSASGETTICSGLTTNLSTSLDVTETGSYQWQYYNGTSWVNVGDNSSSYTTDAITSNTDYRALYTATDIGCGTAYSNTVPITVNNPPVSSIAENYVYILQGGEFVWSGNTNTEWETASNWLVLGTNYKYTVAANSPTSDDKVYFIKYPPCASNHASIPDNHSVTCNRISIFTELSMGNNSYLNVTGDWYCNPAHGLFNRGTGTVELSGDNSYLQVIGSELEKGFYNLLISGNNVKIDSWLRIHNDITITGDFEMRFNQMHLGGNWNSVNATVTDNTHWNNQIYFFGSSNSSIATKHGTIFNLLYVQKVNPSSIVSMSNDFKCKSFEVNKGVFNINSHTLNCSDNFLAIRETDSSPIEDNDIIVNMGSGRINAPTSFVISKGATVNMASGIIDCGRFSLSSAFDGTSVKGRMNMSGGTLYVGSNFTVSKLSLFLGSGGTVIFDGSPAENFDKFEVALSVGEVYFNDVIISDNRIVRMPNSFGIYGDLIIKRNLTINNGAELIHPSQSILIGGNWLNNGTYTTTGNSKVVFDGVAQQEIQAGGSAFSKVTFNNTTDGISDINISEPMKINRDCIFTDGVVNYTGTGSLSFGNSATSTIGNADSYVNGIVSKTGTSVFNFALGEDGAWGPCAIAEPDDESTINAQYIHSAAPNPTIDYMCSGSDLVRASGLEHWLLTSDASHPAITLYWNSESGVADLPNLTVAHYDDATPCWQNKGGNAAGSQSSG
ncbi:MAG: hypothetical protein PHE33_07445, partial [Bacteroidales bacterium]|nr:hypothetical protein [Bacteroidales bacterium]